MAKKRRGKKHPGVVLLKANPERRIWFRARYTHPDTGKSVYETLPEDRTTVEQRIDWAVDKSDELAKRRMQLNAGAARATGISLEDTLAVFEKAHPQLRERTKVIYRTAVKKLNEWASVAGVKSADELTRAKLMQFREHVIATPKRVAVKSTETTKVKRGTYKATGKPRSASAINQDLRSTRTVLGYLTDQDRFCKLSHDDLRRALKRLPATRERIEFLKAAECQKLLEAALRHDADTFDITRDEHKGLRPIGTTLRYDPIAPFAAYLLLTGCRVGEAVELDWEQVDLEALDHQGRAVGEIHLKGAATKTHKARTVDLEVSPALRALLSAMHLKGGRPTAGRVFGMTAHAIDAAGDRLRDEYGGPAFTWQKLRRTCGCFLTNAPGIFGAASAYRSAKQLGHSVQVAEAHYLDVMRGIDREARTLEAAMQIEKQMANVLASVGEAKAPKKVRIA